MTQKHPINADLEPSLPKPAEEPSAHERHEGGAPTAGAAGQATPAEDRQKPRRRRSIPTAFKAIGGLVLVAVVFLVAAVLGGGGSTSDSGSPASSGSADQSEESAGDLDFPASASNNTTRIEGQDAASIAAKVALAVFPSTTQAQRPDVVTLVGEEWDNAVAAAVLMAPPIRSPLLISAAGGNPEPTEQALGALQPQGVTFSSQGNFAVEGPQAFVIGPIATPVLRSSGTQATNGAVQAAEMAQLWESITREPPEHIVIAPEDDAAFALPAGAWAARAGDSVLYSPAEKLPKPTASVLRGHPDIPVYVLGPTSTISSKVVREIAAISKRVKRVSGETPVENAIALARYADGNFGWNVNDPGHGFVIARSDDPIAAAVAAPLSASGTWGPLLLTDSADTLPAALRDYLLDVKPGYTQDPTRAFYNHVWIIGDQEAISVKQQAEIDELAELAKIGGGEP